MIDAKTAIEISRTVKKKNLSKFIEVVELAIKAACNRGDVFVVVDSSDYQSCEEEALDKLRKLGFSVSSAISKCEITIRWDLPREYGS